MRSKQIDCFKEAFLNDSLSDVTFLVGQWPKSRGPVDTSKLMRVPAHKCVVAGVSSVFEGMFVGDLEQRTEVIMDDIHPADFVNLLR